jgi:hypothetical protein
MTKSLEILRQVEELKTDKDDRPGIESKRREEKSFKSPIDWSVSGMPISVAEVCKSGSLSSIS